jgi:hypothetical protein
VDKSATRRSVDRGAGGRWLGGKSSPWLSSARSHLVADASGAPVLRVQGPIGRPGTARPMLALGPRLPKRLGPEQRSAVKGLSKPAPLRRLQ